MRYLILPLILALAGCHHAPQIAYGNEATVQVGGMTQQNERQGFALAERHCRKYGKVPRIVSDQGRRVTFDCVAP